VEVGTGYGWYRSTEDIVDLKTKGKIVSEQEAEVYLMMKVLNT
jgi:hypothetical protein